MSSKTIKSMNHKYRYLIIILVFTILVCQSYVTRASSQSTIHYVDTYMNPRFLDRDLDYCYIYQETLNSCGEASIQMVLKYLDYFPMPNQSELANEMNTDINRYTYCNYIHIPFEKRGFQDYYSLALSRNFIQALNSLKGNVSYNFPVIILTYFNENHKIGHYRVVIGYNSSGIFYHDPAIGPNRFLTNINLEGLWNYSGFWAFIVLKQPIFDLTIELKDVFGNLVPGVNIIISNETNTMILESTNGSIRLNGLNIQTYTIKYDYRLESHVESFILTKSITKRYIIIFSNTVIIILILLLLVCILAISRRSHS